MKTILFLFLIVSNVLVSQEQLKHVVYFETNKYEVLEIEQNRLLLFIKILDSVVITKISIYGFCDDIGGVNYNLKLSQQRADIIKELLFNQDIDKSIISNVNGKGKILLKTINITDATIIRGLNRRTEIIASLKPKVKTVKKKEEKTLNDKLKVGDKILLENILFKTGFREIIPESKETLEKIAEILLEKENIFFTIRGHVCCTKYNREAVDSETKKRNLSLVRAKFIYDYLAKKGVSKKRMKYIGMRRKFPLGGDPKYDRRVEIVITYISNKNK